MPPLPLPPPPTQVLRSHSPSTLHLHVTPSSSVPLLALSNTRPQHHHRHRRRRPLSHPNRPLSFLSSSSSSPSPKLYPTHIPLSPPQHLFLALTSTLGSLLSPSRADLIALCSETTTPLSLLRSLRAYMLSSPSGRAILRSRPRITSSTLPPLSTLQSMAPGTLGRAYATWLLRENVTPNTRLPVRHIPDEELAYVLQRYRESHDFFHVLVYSLPTVREGELAVKAFEFAALGIPMTGLALGSAVTLRFEEERRRFWRVLGPWAVRMGGRVGRELICVRWEEELGGSLEGLRERLGMLEEGVPVEVRGGEEGEGDGEGGLRALRAREREERRKRRRREREGGGGGVG